MNTSRPQVDPRLLVDGFVPTPGAHQLACSDWIEVPASIVRKHTLSGAFFISKEADAYLHHQGLPVDVLLSWFNKPRMAVQVGETLQMGRGLEAFFGFDESQRGPQAFFVEISLRDPSISH